MNTANPSDITSLAKTKKTGLKAAVVAGLVLVLTGGAAYYGITQMRANEVPMLGQEQSGEEPPADFKPTGPSSRLGGKVKAGTLEIEEDSAEAPAPAPAPAPVPAVPAPSAKQKPATPKGFGLTENTEEETSIETPPETGAPQAQATQKQPFQTEPGDAVNLQPPTEAPKPAPPAKEDTSVKKIDPREVGVTTNDGPEKEYEETTLTVQRTLTAVMGEDRQMIRLKVPVMYRSRTLRFEGETLTEARRIQNELKAKAAALASVKTDLEKLLSDWNLLVKKTTPADALLPESPTLPENQSAGTLNRKQNPDLEAGKAITYELVP